MTQLDRIEERLQAIDDRTRAIEIALAEGRGHVGGIARHAIAMTIAAVAGLVGAHIPLPGAH